MPGGVDIHCHIASTAANRARAMQGEEHATHVHKAPCSHDHNLVDRHLFRAGTGNLTPSTFVTGYRYAALGYTTALEAAGAELSTDGDHPSASRSAVWRSIGRPWSRPRSA